MLDKIRIFIYLSITQIQKSSFNISYEKMLETLQGIEQKSNFRNQHRLPRMSDIAVPTLFLPAKYMGIDSEYRLFRMLPELSVASTTAVTEPYPPHLSALRKRMG